MKPWIYQSSAALLTSALLVPLAAANASTAYVPEPFPVTAKDVVARAAASSVKLSKDAALAIASKMAPTSGMELTNVSFRSPDLWRPFPEWSFVWTKKGPNQIDPQTFYHVSIHANTGELTFYSHHDPKNASVPYAQMIQYEEAREKADAFLKKYNPQKAGETKLYARTPIPKTPLNADTPYSFSFVRVVDGVLFPENSIEITVNGSGTVTSYSLVWDDTIRFAAPDSPLSADKARDILREQTVPSLSYVIPWEAQGELRDKPILAYTDPFTLLVDAEDGTVLTQRLVPRTQLDQPEPVSDRKLPARHQGKALTQEEAVKLAVQIFRLSDYELRSAYYSENEHRGDRRVWDLSFEKKGGREYDYTHVSIDAGTGDIYMFSRRPAMPLAQLSPESAPDPAVWKEKAFEAIRTFTPTLADKLYWNEHSASNMVTGSAEYTLVFQRYAGGIPTASGSAAVSFDPGTGEVINYHADLGAETYPAQPPKALSPEKAAEVWWEDAEVEAVYVLQPLSPEESRKAEQSANLPKRTAKLVYRASALPLEQPYFLDAVTGEWRSQFSGKPIVLHREAPQDLEGHPAEKELLLMYEYDALSLMDGKIMPQKEITRGEMIEMLIISLNNGRYYPVFAADREASFRDVPRSSRYFLAVESAVDYGLLDKDGSSLRPDEPITREELATMIVRALGYHQLAEYAEMFRSDLADIAGANERGSIVIATGLGIIPIDGKQFRPLASVSRADAAIAFSRFLEKRDELEPRLPRPYMH